MPKNPIFIGRVMETNADLRCTLLLSETYAVTVAISKPIFTKKLSNHKTLSKLTCAVNTERPRIMWILVLQTNRVMQNLR